MIFLDYSKGSIKEIEEVRFLLKDGQKLVFKEGIVSYDGFFYIYHTDRLRMEVVESYIEKMEAI